MIRDLLAEFSNILGQKQLIVTGLKLKFFVKSFFSYCEQISRSLRICLHLLQKYLMEMFIICAVCSIPIIFTYSSPHSH